MVDLKVGDRVKVTHKAEHDSEGECRRSEYRKALDGCEVEIGAIESDGDLWGAHPAGGAYFRPDELTPVAPRPTIPDVIRAAHVEDVKTITGAALPPIGAHVRPKGGLHAGRTLRVMQHRGGEMLAEKGPWVGWYGPDAVEVLSRVAAAWDAYRTTSPLDTEACAKGLDRALAGVPAPVSPEEPTGLTPDDARAMARLFFAERDQEDGDEDALTGLLMRVSRGEKWTDRPVEAAAREEESTEYQVEIPRPAVPLGDAADLAALIAKVEAHPLHNRGGVVSSALLVDVLRAVERRLVAVETRRPRVGPWTSSGMIYDAGGGTVAFVWSCPGGWGWVANRPHLGPLNGTAETEDAAKAAVLAVLSTWCDVVDAPEPREP